MSIRTLHQSTILLFGREIAGEMERTLYRLPYLPLLSNYDRPAGRCSPDPDRDFIQRLKNPGWQIRQTLSGEFSQHCREN